MISKKYIVLCIATSVCSLNAAERDQWLDLKRKQLNEPLLAYNYEIRERAACPFCNQTYAVIPCLPCTGKAIGLSKTKPALGMGETFKHAFGHKKQCDLSTILSSDVEATMLGHGIIVPAKGVRRSSVFVRDRYIAFIAFGMEKITR